MAEDQMTPARKRQFVLAGILMMLVLALAALVASHGQDLYMSSQGYFKQCSSLPDDDRCDYCKCPDGAEGGPGFGSAQCAGGAAPVCVGAE